MNNIDIGTIIMILTVVGGTIWKFSEIKSEIEKDIDARLDELKDQYLELDAKIDSVSQNLINADNLTNGRITGIHHNAKNAISNINSRIKDLQSTFNQLINYLEKINPQQQKFQPRMRVMSRDTMNEETDDLHLDDSWTQISQIKQK